MSAELLSSKGLKNHIKLGLAFLYAKNILETFVEEDTKECIKEVLGHTKEDDTDVNMCNSCRTSNIIPCPTEGVCKPFNQKKCEYHKGDENKYRPCPKSICCKLKNKIVALCRVKPVWGNTDASKWFTGVLEVAKCFMPQRYQDVSSLKDTDFHGIISIIINNKRFQNKLTLDLTKRKNLCILIRHNCNTFRHSPGFTTEDTFLEETINLLITLLQDSKCLKQMSEHAVTQLEQLKSDTFEINTQDVKKVVNEDILNEPTSQQSENSDSVKGDYVNQFTILRQLRTQLSRDYEEQQVITSNALAEIIDTRAQAVLDLSECTRKLMSSIAKTSEKERRKLKREVKKQRRSFEKEEHAYKKVEIIYTRVDRQVDEEFKKELRDHLIELYMRDYNYLPISPVLDGRNAPLSSFFVNPTMYLIDTEQQPFRNEESTLTHLVNTYEDIFYKGKKKCRNIYLISSAGSGKTCVSKHMTLTWCHAWAKDEEEKHHFESANVEAMKTFGFVFLVSLRNCLAKECDVDEIIRSQLLKHLPEKLQDKEKLEHVFAKEECLVIIDGLDEWSHPTKKRKRCQHFTSKIPHRKLRLKTTILTTSRRWKFHEVSAKNEPVDQHIEMKGLDTVSASLLVTKFVTHLNTRTNKSKSPKMFDDMLKSKGLSHFRMIPLILLQLLCIWYDDKDPGHSKCQIFSNMIELLFKHASRRTNLKEKYKTVCQNKGKRSNKTLPSCFKDAPICIEFRHLLFSLAKLSYETLFGENFENTTVFDKNVVDTYLTEDELKLCRETGILLQSKEASQLTSDDINFSFSHKSFQELLAAIFISTKSDLPSNMLPKIMKKVTGLKDIMRMEMFLIFVTGLSPGVMKSLSNEFLSLVSKEEVTMRYRRNIGTLFIKDKQRIHDLSDLMVECVKEGIANGYDTCVYLDDVFVDAACTNQNFRTAMAKLVETNKSRMKTLYIHTHQTVADKDLAAIMDELRLDYVQSLEKLYVWGNVPSHNVGTLMRNSSETITCLEMWNIKMSQEYLDAMALMKPTGLSLMSVSLTHHQIDCLMKCLTSNRDLKQLNLNKLNCSDHEEKCSGFTLQLCNEARLQLIVLDKVYVTDISINAKCLQTCIAELLPKPNALSSLAKCLQDAPVLKRFECDSPACEMDTESVTNLVQECVHLLYFRLRNVDLSSRNLNLSKLHSLMRIDIWHSSMTSAVFRGIVDDVASLSKPVIVIVENCSISSPDETEDVKDYVRKSKKFEVLFEKAGKYQEFRFQTIKSCNR